MHQPAPFERPSKHTALRAYAGEIHAAPAAVFDAVARRLRTDVPANSLLLIDDESLVAVVQGGWWYRAEYRALSSDSGTRIEHELVNVAPSAHWAAPIAGRRVIAESPQAFGRLLTALADELEG